MSEQRLDTRAVASLLRRARWVLFGAALVGLAGGIVFGVVRPPLYSSYSQVLLPPPVAANGQPVTRDTGTLVEVAMSDAVLGPVRRALSPPLSLLQMLNLVNVTAGSSDVLNIEGRGDTAQAAQTVAQEVAKSFVAYEDDAMSSLSQAQLAELRDRMAALASQEQTVTNEIATTKKRLASEPPRSAAARTDAATVSQLTAEQSALVLEIATLRDQIDASQTGAATIIQSATPAERPRLVLYTGLWGLAGAVLALLLASAAAIVRGRGDKRLRTRDEIADALGSTVIASVRSRTPRDAAGWAMLLSTYDPEAVEVWAWRQALDRLGLGDRPGSSPGGDREVSRNSKNGHDLETVTVVALAGDRRGLTAAAQLASHVAQLGFETVLEGLQRDASADDLWTCLATYPPGSEIRPGLVSAASRRASADAELVIRLAVLDAAVPFVVDLTSHPTVVFSVASLSATAEDLARAAVAVFEAGGRVEGVVVADPDPADRTTGRFLAPERARQRPFPTRLTGVDSGPLASGGA